jgi:hypothetical protein
MIDDVERARMERELIALHSALVEACRRLKSGSPAPWRDLVAVLDDPEGAPRPWENWDRQTRAIVREWVR